MQSAKLIQCGHCGKRAVFHVRCEGTKNGDVLLDPYNNIYDGQTLTTWRILECALCKKPTLTEEIVEYYFDIEGYYEKVTKIYSAETTFTDKIVPRARAEKKEAERLENRHTACRLFASVSLLLVGYLKLNNTRNL